MARKPATPLSDAERDRIHLEEQYRSEVRAALANQDSGNRFIRFFNTSLGLWLLSTIFISGLGTAYALAKESWDSQRIIEKEVREQTRRRDELIRMLDLEIGFRLSNLIAYLHGKHLAQAGEDTTAKPEKITPRRITFMIQVPPSQSVTYQYPTLSLYAENKEKTIISLLAELSLKERELGHDTRDIDRVIARLSAIPMLFKRKRIDEAEANARILASALQEEAFLNRWRNNAFSFTDCTPKEPFC